MLKIYKYRLYTEVEVSTGFNKRQAFAKTHALVNKVISTALYIMLYSAYAGLYGSGLFNSGSCFSLPAFVTCFLVFDVPTSSFIFIGNVFIIIV